MQDKEELKPFINDYKLNLFDFHEKNNFGGFQTELRTLFEFLRYSEDEQALNNAIQSNAERYHSLDKETARLISELTGVDAEEYSEEISIKEEKESDKEDDGRSEFDMCKAWDDHKERGRAEGIAGLIATCKDFNASFETTLDKLKEHLSLSEADAQKYMKMYW